MCNEVARLFRRSSGSLRVTLIFGTLGVSRHLTSGASLATRKTAAIAMSRTDHAFSSGCFAQLYAAHSELVHTQIFSTHKLNERALLGIADPRALASSAEAIGGLAHEGTPAVRTCRVVLGVDCLKSTLQDYS